MSLCMSGCKIKKVAQFLGRHGMFLVATCFVHWIIHLYLHYRINKKICGNSGISKKSVRVFLFRLMIGPFCS